MSGRTYGRIVLRFRNEQDWEHAQRIFTALAQRGILPDGCRTIISSSRGNDLFLGKSCGDLLRDFNEYTSVGGDVTLTYRSKKALGTTIAALEFLKRLGAYPRKLNWQSYKNTLRLWQ